MVEMQEMREVSYNSGSGCRILRALPGSPFLKLKQDSWRGLPVRAVCSFLCPKTSPQPCGNPSSLLLREDQSTVLG